MSGRCASLLAVSVAIAAGMALQSTVPGRAETILLSCTARGNSHTARMTFDYYPGECRLYWREIDRMLTLDVCNHPVLKAQRPFAGETDSYLLFNLQSGDFVSRFGGVDDRGRCEAATAGR